MSEIKVDKISPQSGTALAVGDSGDTITIPSGATITNSGTATGFGGGKVLQVVSVGVTSTSLTSTSASFVDITGYTLSITPSATSSKILVTGSVYTGYSAQNWRDIQLVRDSTAIQNCPYYDGGADNAETIVEVSFNILDTPATTSATTYKVQWKTSGNTIALNKSTNGLRTCITSTLIATEIGA